MNSSNFSVPPPFSNCECPQLNKDMSCVDWGFKQKITVACVAGVSFGVAITTCILLIKKYTFISLRLRKISGRFMALDPVPEHNTV